MSDKLMTFVLAGAVFMALLKDLVEYLKKIKGGVKNE